MAEGISFTSFILWTGFFFFFFCAVPNTHQQVGGVSMSARTLGRAILSIVLLGAETL